MALNVSYTYEGSPGFAQKEIRLTTLGGDVRGIAAQTTGLGGQSYVGPSFDEGALYWARYCAGDESACNKNNSGTFRYRLSTSTYALAGHTRKLTGFSYVDDNRVYEVRGERECGTRVGNPPTAGFPDCQASSVDVDSCSLGADQQRAAAGRGARWRVHATDRLRPPGRHSRRHSENAGPRRPATGHPGSRHRRLGFQLVAGYLGHHPENNACALTRKPSAILRPSNLHEIRLGAAVGPLRTSRAGGPQPRRKPLHA